GQRVDALLVEPDGAAGELHEPGDAVERGRLPATRGPEQADEFAALDRQRELVQRVEGLATGAGKPARDAVELEFLEVVFHRGRNLSGRVILSFGRRPRCPIAGMPRPPLSLRASGHAGIARARLRTR